MIFALNRDNTCLMSLLAGAFYQIQSREYNKAIDAYHVILTCNSFFSHLINRSS